MNIHKFCVERKISSYRIERKALIELEKYMHGISDQYKEMKNYIFIIDDCGTEYLNSINDYNEQPSPYFDDKTKMISLLISCREAIKELNISLIFKKRMAELTISICDENPREKAETILKDILKIMEPYKSINRLFMIPLHKGWKIIYFYTLFLCASMFNIILDYYKINPIYNPFQYIISFYFVFSLLMPHSVFYTKRNERFINISKTVSILILSAIVSFFTHLLLRKVLKI